MPDRIALVLTVILICIPGPACNLCPVCPGAGSPSPGFAGIWVGAIAGLDEITLDGSSQPRSERSVDFTIVFNEQGRLVGLAFIGPTGWFWPTDVLELSQVGDTDELQLITHTYQVRQDVTLKEVSYTCEGVHIICGGDFSAINPGNTAEGAGTLTVDVTLADGRLAVQLRADFDYQRGVVPGGPIDPGEVVHVVETFSGSTVLDRQ